MGRLHHLSVTLSRNLQDNLRYPDLEFVILDYNSPDGLREWIHETLGAEIQSGRIKYVRTDQPERFHMARAKNMAHRAASGEILCNLDADNFTGPDFAFFIDTAMRSHTNRIGSSLGLGPWKGTGGRIFIHREAFERLGGYDESYVGWGHDDADFVDRARLAGMDVLPIPLPFLECLPHDNAERDRMMNISMEESIRINQKHFREKRKRNYRSFMLDGACFLES